ncbi:hypothetical protein [Aquisediminimonas sediminicola]|uniref:hypothetical protein n=1 Tax=Alteraquisediminimonas sediminicola TaxID=2676787 RepID=UPI001C8ED59E|nr:hypothetical protein [Aquisediminimonas sediminicola]
MLKNRINNYERTVVQRFIPAATGPIWLTGWLGGGLDGGLGDNDRPLLFVPPLFGEMNRCRRLMADCAMLLVQQGFSCWMIDLPGTGESETDPALLTLDDWHDAVDRAASDIKAEAIIALRGGAILGRQSQHLPHWSLAAIDGPTIIRELLRLRMANDRGLGLSSTSAQLMALGSAKGLNIGGYWLSPALFEGLSNIIFPYNNNVISYQLETNSKKTDSPTLQGEPMWRHAEPGRSLPMAAAMANAITTWLD